MTPAQQYLEQIERLGGEATEGELSTNGREIFDDVGSSIAVVHTAFWDSAGDTNLPLFVALHNSRDAVGRVIRAAEDVRIVTDAAFVVDTLLNGDPPGPIKKALIGLRAALNDLPVEAQHPTGDTP